MQANLQLLFVRQEVLDTVGRPVSLVLEKEGLMTPPTIEANVAIMGIMYLMFIIGGFLSMKYLYRERR